MHGVKKAQLPTKQCPICNRPFTWRKKWAKTWDQVVYCSERCRRTRLRVKPGISRTNPHD